MTARGIRRRWFWYVTTRNLTLFALLVLAAIAALTLTVVLTQASIALGFKTQTQAAWSAVITIATVIVIVGGGFLVSAGLAAGLIARAFGMVCARCGCAFDRQAFEIAVAHDCCILCLRQQSLAAEAKLTTAPSGGVAEANPYTSPGITPAPPPPLRPATFLAPLPGRQLASLLAITTVYGWLAALPLLIVTLVGFGRAPFGVSIDSQTPAWFRQLLDDDIRRNSRRTLNLGGIWTLVFVASLALWSAFEPLRTARNLILGSHLACGFATGWVVIKFRSRSAGRPAFQIVPANGGESCFTVHIFPQNLAASLLHFRTQTATGIRVKIVDLLTWETLASRQFGEESSEKWNAADLSLATLFASGHGLGGVQLTVESCDGRPWLISYDPFG